MQCPNGELLLPCSCRTDVVETYLVYNTINWPSMLQNRLPQTHLSPYLCVQKYWFYWSK